MLTRSVGFAIRSRMFQFGSTGFGECWQKHVRAGSMANAKLLEQFAFLASRTVPTGVHSGEVHDRVQHVRVAFVVVVRFELCSWKILHIAQVVFEPATARQEVPMWHRRICSLVLVHLEISVCLYQWLRLLNHLHRRWPKPNSRRPLKEKVWV